jgi:hypothetical protein
MWERPAVGAESQKNPPTSRDDSLVVDDVVVVAATTFFGQWVYVAGDDGCRLWAWCDLAAKVIRE